MKNPKALLFSGILLGMSHVSALEFGGMGNISASMGGAGVALKNSQWGLYYNPALLGVSKKNRFAYSFGATIRDNNLLSLANVDIKNLQSLPNQITSLFGGTQTKAGGRSANSGVSLLGAASLGGVNVFAADDPLKLPNGYFGEVVKNLLGTTGGGELKEQDLTNFLNGITGNTDSSGSLDAAIDKFKEIAQTDPGKILDQTKDKILAASAAAGGNALLDTIISNLDSENIGGIAELLKDVATNGANIDVSKVLGTLNGIEISRSGDASLDKAINDINLIQNTLRRNNFSLSTQNGFVFQSKPNEDVGGFGVGLFASAFASGSASFDSTHNRIIVEAAGKYVELGIDGDNVSLNIIDNTSGASATYENSSVFSNNAKHHISVSGLVVGEVPVGYGHNINVGVGELSLGMSLKYIYGMGYRVAKTGSFDDLTSISFGTAPVVSHNFGIDLGALYSLGGMSLGIVAKNINNPSLLVDEAQRVYLNPQVRAGVSFEWGALSLAFDADLLPNHTLSYTAPKNQMIGGGMMLDFKVIDFRAGAMYDIRSPFDEGLILTGGINLFGFLDIAVQSNMHLTQIRGYSLPSYFSLKVGGGFSW